MGLESYHVLAFLALLVSILTTTATPIPCSENTPCKSGEYCGVQSYCETCIPCENLNRQPANSTSTSDGASCAKSRIECGPCLPGHQNANDGEISIKCYALSQADSTHFPDWWTWWAHWWSIFGFIWLSVFTLYTFWRKLSRCVCCICRRRRTPRPIQSQASIDRENGPERITRIPSEIIAMLESTNRSNNTPSTVSVGLKTP